MLPAASLAPVSKAATVLVSKLVGFYLIINKWATAAARPLKAFAPRASRSIASEAIVHRQENGPSTHLHEVSL